MNPVWIFQGSRWAAPRLIFVGGLWGPKAPMGLRLQSIPAGFTSVGVANLKIGTKMVANELAGDGFRPRNLRQPVERIPAGITDFPSVDVDIA